MTGIHQTLTIYNNTITYDKEYLNASNIFNNIYIAYVNTNKRPKDIFIDSNTFTAMHDSVYPILHVEFYTTGKVYLTGNTFYDSSSEKDMIELDANEAIILKDNKFEHCIEKSNGFLKIGTAKTVNITGLVVTHTV